MAALCEFLRRDQHSRQIAWLGKLSCCSSETSMVRAAFPTATMRTRWMPSRSIVSSPTCKAFSAQGHVTRHSLLHAAISEGLIEDSPSCVSQICHAFIRSRTYLQRSPEGKLCFTHRIISACTFSSLPTKKWSASWIQTICFGSGVVATTASTSATGP